MFGGMKANSSKKIILYDPPRMALEDVAAASILLLFSNSKEPLFQFNTPCCKKLGIFSYANCNRPNKSLAVEDLLARIATFTFGLNIT